jgi:predicted RNA binding protein YcfA (HicA-like mRNA interferase family)
MVAIETTRTKIAARLRREGWTERHGGDHDVFSHTKKPGRIVVPRHRVVSLDVKGAK